MEIGRRLFVVAGGVAAVAITRTTLAMPRPRGDQMHGLIGKMLVRPGQRDEVIAILTESVQDMPGCLSYVVGEDPTNADAIWITEVWDSEASHQASLSLPAVKDAIARARPLIAGFGERFITVPVGGHGLRRQGGG